jgi:glycolate oxidase
MPAHTFYRPEDTQYTVDPETLFSRLREHLDEESLIVHESGLRPYECDGLATYKQLPVGVAVPSSVAQLQAVMRICHELGVPVVARGAGTSLSGGALPHPQGILLSLAKFNQILDIDDRRRLARVQPGVRNLAVSEAAAPYGLYYAPDPSSQIACTIGGNIAENAGGVHCLKYGLTVHNVLAMKMVTVEGELVEIGGSAPDSPGYDLAALMIGSEGMLGVVVEATLQLLPEPVCKDVLLAAFSDVGDGGRAVAAIIADGIVPAGLEMMDGPAIQAAEDFAHAGYPTEAAAILICELDGSKDEVAELVLRVMGDADDADIALDADIFVILSVSRLAHVLLLALVDHPAFFLK